MDIGVALNKLSEFLSNRMPAKDDDFSHVAFDVLKTMMLLAAVDGTISRAEVSRFWTCAQEIGSFPGDELRDLWKSALCSAGYLSLQCKLTDIGASTDEFMRLVEEGLVKKLARATESVRGRALDCLRSMADADGDFSPVEKSCVDALIRRLGEMRDRSAISGAIRL